MVDPLKVAGDRAMIEGEIRRILASDLGVDPLLLAGSGADTLLLGRGIGIDSMETLVLVSGLESAFEIEMADEDLTVELFRSIGSLATYVLTKLPQPTAARGPDPV